MKLIDITKLVHQPSFHSEHLLHTAEAHIDDKMLEYACTQSTSGDTDAQGAETCK